MGSAVVGLQKVLDGDNFSPFLEALLSKSIFRFTIWDFLFNPIFFDWRLRVDFLSSKKLDGWICFIFLADLFGDGSNRCWAFFFKLSVDNLIFFVFDRITPSSSLRDNLHDIFLDNKLMIKQIKITWVII